MKVLAEQIAAALGVGCAGTVELTPGRTRRALKIDTGDASLFVKLLPAGRTEMFAAEMEGLALLRDTGCFRVPAARGCGTAGDVSWLALEWLDLKPVSTDEDGRAFGKALAALHEVHGELYGLPRDNWLGDSRQENGTSTSWPLFYAQKRLRPQLERLIAEGMRGELISNLQGIVERVPALFLEYRPAASLLHGDLWHGNAAMVDGQPAVFDPAVHYGDREADYVMTELFGGFPISMYASYQKSAPLDAGAASRRGLYRLYHLLNHILLFGSPYLRETERTAARLLSELR
ncbi:fructosamine kinase family protein [Methyloversatilis discipulorum]|uniref:fructosamine kinase family protein n=1 Tax=Methyloversatilis discipulorum TaxID=1119528 RepID=UPI001A3CE92D|nr:fructosamine kinase family protein [Methyloversatilis discipulorum]MBL8467519.1 fructosamine kinase family protein [Methyloversatilis discipulorum]